MSLEKQHEQIKDQIEDRIQDKFEKKMRVFFSDLFWRNSKQEQVPWKQNSKCNANEETTQSVKNTLKTTLKRKQTMLLNQVG